MSRDWVLSSTRDRLVALPQGSVRRAVLRIEGRNLGRQVEYFCGKITGITETACFGQLALGHNHVELSSNSILRNPHSQTLFLAFLCFLTDLSCFLCKVAGN